MTTRDVVADQRTQASDELVLAVPAEPGIIAVARLFVAAACRHAGFEEEVIDDARIATSEAVTNAVKAHMAAGEKRPLRVIARPVGDGQMVIEVIDAGPGFEVREQPPADGATPASGLFEGSLGLTVIRSLFPDLQISRNPDRGMTVSFTVCHADDRPANDRAEDGDDRPA